jgi:hypothetical protein
MFGTGLAYELAVRMSSDTAYRAAAGIALAAAFILIWVNLAVGIIGSEDELANLMYFGVLAVGIIGALIARFQPHGTRAVCDGAHAGVSRRDRAARRMGLHGALYNPWSLHNAESQVDSLRRFDHFESFERDMFAAETLEQPRAAAKQHRDEVNRDFVNEAACDELLCNV